LGKVRMELEVMERGKKKTNLGDNHRERRNQAEKLRNQKMDRRR